MITYKVVLNLNVLFVLSQYRGVADEDGTPILRSNQGSHSISKVGSNRTQYLALILEQDTIVCFLLCQEIRESPRKKQ